MDEFPWGQMFTAIAALGGAAIGSWGTSWGALRREKLLRAAAEKDAVEERDRTALQLRQEALVAFCDAYLTMSGYRSPSNLQAAHVARSQFVATLREGEGSVAAHTLTMMRTIAQSAAEVADDIDELYAWSRGEVEL